MRKHLSLLALIVGAAACGQPATPADDLTRDLGLAAGPNVELAPRAAGTQVVSDLEQGPQRSPARAPSVKAPAPRPAAVPHVVARAPRAAAPAPVPAPETTVARAPEPEREVAPEPMEAPQPTSAPIGAPERRGGYRSVSDVIRNAPFPITPLDHGRGVGR